MMNTAPIISGEIGEPDCPKREGYLGELYARLTLEESATSLLARCEADEMSVVGPYQLWRT